MKEKIIELIKSKDLKELRALLIDANEADISECFDDLSDEDIVIVFKCLTKDQAADVFAYLEPDVQEVIIKTLSDKELAAIVNEQFPDDIADMVEEMPANIVKRILASTDPDTRKAVNELLQYAEDSAGSIMNVEYVDLKETMTAEEALRKIRKNAKGKETIYYFYVTDSRRRLVGVVTIKELILADEDALIKDIMEDNVISVTTITDKEEVAQMFDKYDFLAMPVVDKENKLIGIVTIDDAMDVMSDESEEDFEKMAAMAPSDDSYLKTSVFTMYKNRIIWLLFLMLSATFTGLIITRYETAFEAIPILVSFIPMVMDTGGNCGSQASTMIIRGLATDEIELTDILKVWFKEIRVALLCGVTLAIVNGIRIFIMYGSNISLALVVGITIILTACIAKSLGCILPMIAKKIGLDPAYMASPMITTIVDACSILIYFNVACLLMQIV